SGPAALRRQADQGTRDLELADRLDAVRMETAGYIGFSGVAKTDDAYAEAFRAAGLGTVDDAPYVVADRIRGSHIRDALVAACDNWVLFAEDSGRKRWVLQAARQVNRDADVRSWIARARDPGVRKYQVVLKELVRTAPTKDAPVALLL